MAGWHGRSRCGVERQVYNCDLTPYAGLLVMVVAALDGSAVSIPLSVTLTVRKDRKLW